VFSHVLMCQIMFNLDKLLKFNLGYKEWGCIRTSPNHLDSFHKDVFVMIKQLRPPTFFYNIHHGCWQLAHTNINIKRMTWQKYVTIFKK
jgi:hypothetical protein